MDSNNNEKNENDEKLINEKNITTRRYRSIEEFKDDKDSNENKISSIIFDKLSLKSEEIIEIIRELPINIRNLEFKDYKGQIVLEDLALPNSLKSLTIDDSFIKKSEIFGASKNQIQVNTIFKNMFNIFSKSNYISDSPFNNLEKLIIDKTGNFDKIKEFLPSTLKELVLRCGVVKPLTQLPEQLYSLVIYYDYRFNKIYLPPNLKKISIKGSPSNLLTETNVSVLKNIPSSIQYIDMYVAPFSLLISPMDLDWLNDSNYSNLQKLKIGFSFFNKSFFKSLNDQFDDSQTNQDQLELNIQYYSNNLKSLRNLRNLKIYFDYGKSPTVQLNILPQEQLKKIEIEYQVILSKIGFGISKTVEHYGGSFASISLEGLFQNPYSIKSLSLNYFQFQNQAIENSCEYLNKSNLTYSRFKNLQSLSIKIRDQIFSTVILPQHDSDINLLNLEMNDLSLFNYFSDFDLIPNDYLLNSNIRTLKLNQTFTLFLLKLFKNSETIPLPPNLQVLDLYFDKPWCDLSESRKIKFQLYDTPILLPPSIKVLIIRGKVLPSFKLPLPSSINHIFIEYDNPIMDDVLFKNSNKSLIIPFSENEDSNYTDKSKLYNFLKKKY